MVRELAGRAGPRYWSGTRARRRRGHRGGLPGGGEIAESYGQARRSLRRPAGTAPAVVAFAELGIQRLLLQVPDVGGLRSFAHEVLGQALDQDSAGGTEHLRTLVAYFRANCSPRAAAAGCISTRTRSATGSGGSRSSPASR